MASYHEKTWGQDKLKLYAFRRTKSVRDYLGYLRGKAINRGGACVTLDELVEIWNAQKGRCALTGWEMTMKLGSGVIPTNCSIDRIDSSRSYEVGNVQLVCRAVNIAKSNLTPELFIMLCSAIAERASGIQDSRMAA